jgi:hypothetical protein
MIGIDENASERYSKLFQACFLLQAGRRREERSKEVKNIKTIPKNLKNMALTIVVMCKDLSEGT